MTVRLVVRLLLGLTFTAVAVAVAAEPIGPAALGPRTVRFIYEARATPPPEAREFELWLPLPREEDQQVLDVKLTGTAPVTVVRLSGSGDRAAYLHPAQPKGTMTLTGTATVARDEVRATPSP